MVRILLKIIMVLLTLCAALVAAIWFFALIFTSHFWGVESTWFNILAIGGASLAFGKESSRIAEHPVK